MLSHRTLLLLFSLYSKLLRGMLSIGMFVLFPGRQLVVTDCLYSSGWHCTVNHSCHEESVSSLCQKPPIPTFSVNTALFLYSLSYLRHWNLLSTINFTLTLFRTISCAHFSPVSVPPIELLGRCLMSRRTFAVPCIIPISLRCACFISALLDLY